MSMETTVEQIDGAVPVTVLALDGELDASNFRELIDTVKGLYDEGTRQLIIDLAGLRFMASSGLVALHSIVQVMHGEEPLDPEGGWQALHSLGGEAQTEVRLAGPQPAVDRVLKRTGLDRMFVVHADRYTAIDAATAPA
jgi:anti-sigma B factor antagonist